MMRGWIVALVGLAFSACTAPPQASAPEAPKPQAVQKYVHDSKLDTDAAACAAQHGEIRRVCLTGTRMCVVNFSDGGKACRDSSECQGRCLADSPTQQGQQTTGKCAKADEPCGCFIMVKNGIAQPGLCVD